MSGDCAERLAAAEEEAGWRRSEVADAQVKVENLRIERDEARKQTRQADATLHERSKLNHQRAQQIRDLEAERDRLRTALLALTERIEFVPAMGGSCHRLRGEPKVREAMELARRALGGES